MLRFLRLHAKINQAGLLRIVSLECIWIIRMFVPGHLGKTEAKINGDIGGLFALTAVSP